MKILMLIGVIALLYTGSIFFRAHQWERAAEKYIEVAILDIAKPWSAERLANRSSWWLREKSRLRPAEITNLASQDFGNLVEIAETPECNLQQGKDAYADVEHTYAICVITGKFEKSIRTLTIRLQEDSDGMNGGWKINDFISVK